MKHLFFIILSILISLRLSASNKHSSEFKKIKLHDKEMVLTKLYLPENDFKTIVLAVHGTGPHTHLNKQKKFNFYDEVAEGFCEQGVAFFTNDRRGVTVGDTPPYFYKIDTIKYSKYLPSTEVLDVETMVSYLRKRFKDCKIILYGLSEGTMIASMVAERKNVDIDAIFLHGYAHENLYDIIKWQNEGNGLIVMMNATFDKNMDNAISRDEYESMEQAQSNFRQGILKDTPFHSLDVTKDSLINIDDISQMREGAQYFKTLSEKIIAGDDRWIMKNYVPVSSKWLKEHYAIEPNKTRLLRVDIPIFIFHGTDDANVSVEGVFDLKTRFEACNKENLTVNVFKGHNHDLNFLDRITKKEWSEGYRSIFKNASDF